LTSDQAFDRLRGTLLATIRRTGYGTQAQQLEYLISNVDQHSPADVMLVQTACDLLYSTQGQVRMRELAQHCCLSMRQFERRIKMLTGFTPKLLARLIRFEALRDKLLTLPATRSSDLAYDFGYTDQIPMIREFKAFAGWTPTQFIDAAIQRSMTRFYYTPDPRVPYHACIGH
jgi:AraC-like DNA-binding protein